MSNSAADKNDMKTARQWSAFSFIISIVAMAITALELIIIFIVYLIIWNNDGNYSAQQLGLDN